MGCLGLLKFIIILDEVSICIIHVRQIKSCNLTKWVNLNVSTVPWWKLVEQVDDFDIKQYRRTKSLQKKQKLCWHSQLPSRKKRCQWQLFLKYWPIKSLLLSYTEQHIFHDAFVFTLREVKFHLIFNFISFSPHLSKITWFFLFFCIYKKTEMCFKIVIPFKNWKTLTTVFYFKMLFGSSLQCTN